MAARECSEAASLIGMAEFHYDYYVYPLHDGNWAPPPRSQWLFLPPKQVQRVEKNDKQVFLADLMAGMGVYLPYVKVLGCGHMKGRPPSTSSARGAI